MIVPMIDYKKSAIKDLESVYGEDGFVDVTERVKCYEKGKVWSCNCGQDIGVTLNRREIVCASCGRTNIDLEWTNRESEERNSGQSSLDDFL